MYQYLTNPESVCSTSKFMDNFDWLSPRFGLWKTDYLNWLKLNFVSFLVWHCFSGSHEIALICFFPEVLTQHFRKETLLRDVLYFLKIIQIMKVVTKVIYSMIYLLWIRKFKFFKNSYSNKLGHINTKALYYVLEVSDPARFELSLYEYCWRRFLYDILHWTPPPCLWPH